MFIFFKVWQRKRANAKKFRDRAFELRDQGYCHYCNGDAHSIRTKIARTSPAGETFYYLSMIAAYTCLRCSFVGSYSDCSGEETPIDDWLAARENK